MIARLRRGWARCRATLATAAVLMLLLAAWRVWFVFGAPVAPALSFAEVRAAYRSSDVLVLDRHAEVIHEIRTDPRRRRLGWVPLAEVSPALTAAVLRSEDRRFFTHGGVDGRAVAAAVLQRLQGRPLRGASTITMQLATLLAGPAPDRHAVSGARPQAGPAGALARKWRQMRLAWRIETGWSKPEILEAYLNLVSFRGEIQGISASANALFGKAPHGLDEDESAVLAVLVRAPNAPPEVVARRAEALLGRPRASSTDSRGSQPVPPAPREVSSASASLGTARPSLQALVMQVLDRAAGPASGMALAPHAAERAVRSATSVVLSGDRLPSSAGAGLDRGRRHLVPADRHIATTLDADLQRVAIAALARHLSAVRAQRVQDGAVLVVDNASGDVLAYVGGSGNELSSARHVDGIRARRQAGSTLKPFLYGLALEQRLITSATLIEDTPLDVPAAGGVYQPRNYDQAFKGLVSARTALASSLNVPAVRTLGLLGEDAALEQLQRLGFEGLTEEGDFYGPSMALGSADVSLWELVNAYRALARGGLWSSSRLLRGEPAAAERRVYSTRAAFLVSSILSDRESRGPTFGLENPLATRYWTAVKTGTSKEMRDNWCVGYSARYTVGVWVGNFSGEPMRNVSGVTGAAPVWAEVMGWLHRTTPSTAPEPPAGVVASPVRFHGVAEADRVEWFIAGTEPRPGTAVDSAAAEPRPGAGVDGDAPALAGGHPRIIAPVAGTIIALDPDIPDGRQRLVFEATSAGRSLRFILDGDDMGPAADLVVWSPTRGRHTLSLIDETARVVDRVTFEVRGAPRRAAAR